MRGGCLLKLYKFGMVFGLVNNKQVQVCYMEHIIFIIIERTSFTAYFKPDALHMYQSDCLLVLDSKIACPWSNVGGRVGGLSNHTEPNVQGHNVRCIVGGVWCCMEGKLKSFGSFSCHVGLSILELCKH